MSRIKNICVTYCANAVYFLTTIIFLCNKILLLLHSITISRRFPYITGLITVYQNEWPNNTENIVITFIPCIPFKSLFLSNLIRSRPLLIIENEFKTNGISTANSHSQSLINYDFCEKNKLKRVQRDEFEISHVRHIS